MLAKGVLLVTSRDKWERLGKTHIEKVCGRTIKVRVPQPLVNFVNDRKKVFCFSGHGVLPQPPPPPLSGPTTIVFIFFLWVSSLIGQILI